MPPETTLGMLPEQLLGELRAAGTDQPIRSLAARVRLAQPSINRCAAYLMIIGETYKNADDTTRTVIQAAAARFASAQPPCRLDAEPDNEAAITLGDAIGLTATGHDSLL